MPLKQKTKKIISALLIIFILVPSILFSRPQTTEAVGPVHDFITHIFTGTSAPANVNSSVQNTTATALSIKQFAKEVAKQILMNIAKKALQDMTKSTVNWINSGFHGSPLFIENPKSFFKDIGKFQVKTLVDQIGYNTVKFPFGKQTALDIIRGYKNTAENNAQYTLSKVINDPTLLKQYQNNFDMGGWNGFLINTQYPQNNPVGYNMIVQKNLANELQDTYVPEATKVKELLQQGNGFLSPQVCDNNPNYSKLPNPYNPKAFKSKLPIPDYDKCFKLKGLKIDECMAQQEALASTYDQNVAEEKAVWDDKYSCTGNVTSTTPGSLVGDQIKTALGSSPRQLELAAAMGNSVSAILDSLVNKFLGDGLNALASKKNKPPVEKDDWSFDGHSLGSPSDGNNNTWDSGPDEVIVLNEFKKSVQQGIDNTAQELKFISNESPSDPGIMQMLSNIWPKARELDICLPGPDRGWKDRTLKELERNSGKLSEKENDDDPEEATRAKLAFRELEYTVDAFKDWINNRMILELPSSILYMDAIDELETAYQQSEELTTNRRNKASALARLEAIKISLNNIATQPTPGSAEEKVLINFKKQYLAVSNSIGNTSTVEDMNNELAIAKEKYQKLNKFIIQCNAERAVKGWSTINDIDISSGGTSTLSKPDSYGISGTERNVFCDAPIQGGFNHESFTHDKDEGGVGVTHPDVPYVNATDVFKFDKAFGSGHVKIEMKCDLIYKSSPLDYKGTIPGLTQVIEEYKPSASNSQAQKIIQEIPGFDIPAGGTTIDMEANSGSLFVELAKNSPTAKIYAIRENQSEINTLNTKVVTAKLTNVIYALGGLEKLTNGSFNNTAIKPKSVDRVIMQNMLPSTGLKLLPELEKVVKTGGKVLLIDSPKTIITQVFGVKLPATTENMIKRFNSYSFYIEKQIDLGSGNYGIVFVRK